MYSVISVCVFFILVWLQAYLFLADHHHLGSISELGKQMDNSQKASRLTVLIHFLLAVACCGKCPNYHTRFDTAFKLYCKNFQLGQWQLFLAQIRRERENMNVVVSNHYLFLYLLFHTGTQSGLLLSYV
jgi:hypothetical protein